MSRLRTTVLALGVFAALGAAATAEAQRSAPRARPAQQQQQGQACTPDQMAVIDAAYAEADIRLRRAIAWLNANPHHPHVTRFFGTTPRKIIREHYAMLHAAIVGPRHEIRCDTSCPLFAFTDSRTHITFCRRFFAAPLEGRDAQYGVVIHEMSHIVLGTRDAAYQDNAERLAAAEPATAATNAENYEYFVELLPVRSRPRFPTTK